MDINYSYEIAALIIYVFCGFLLIADKGTKRRQNRILLAAFSSCVIGTCCSLNAAIIASEVDFVGDGFALMFKLSQYGYHVTHSLLAFLTCLYVIEVTGKWNQIGSFKRALLSIPLLLFYIMLVVNVFTPLVFDAENGIYTRYPGVYVEYVSAAIYAIVAAIIIITNRAIITFTKKVGLVAFFTISFVGVLLQLLNPLLLVEVFSEALGLLALLFSVEDDRASRDVVTGVTNRNTFVADNIRFMSAVSNYQVVFVKLANYRNFLEAMGVLAMNEILADIATWMADDNQEFEVYYLENGTFAFSNYKWNEYEVEKLVNKIRLKFSAYWTYGSITVPFNTQIYIVKVPKDVNNVNDLLSLIESDNSITDQVVSCFSGEDLQFVKRKSDVEAAIKRAITNNTLQVYYQPIWDSNRNRINSAEALVRLIDDELGFIPPDEFIPISEQTGQILDIGMIVFETVCKNIKEQNFRELGIEYVDVNLSPVQCMQSNLDEAFKLIMDRYGVTTDQINLEITETAAADSPEMFAETMNKLKAMGFKFSLDDYGTGFANLSYMVDMDFHIIKIDKSILWNAEENEVAKVILDNTIRMIKEMGVNIITEGVETSTQRDYLKSVGCDYCQGYYFSKPVERDKFVDYCKSYKSEVNQTELNRAVM